MEPSDSFRRPPTLPRRRFLELTGAAVGLSAAGCASAPASAGVGPAPATGPAPTPPAFVDRFDPWVEIDRGAFAHNVREASRLADGRPILAVVKNDGYGCPRWAA
jgi:hypothetical protein